MVRFKFPLWICYVLSIVMLVMCSGLATSAIIDGVIWKICLAILVGIYWSVMLVYHLIKQDKEIVRIQKLLDYFIMKQYKGISISEPMTIIIKEDHTMEQVEEWL